MEIAFCEHEDGSRVAVVHNSIAKNWDDLKICQPNYLWIDKKDDDKQMLEANVGSFVALETERERERERACVWESG